MDYVTALSYFSSVLSKIKKLLWYKIWSWLCKGKWIHQYMPSNWIVCYFIIQWCTTLWYDLLWYKCNSLQISPAKNALKEYTAVREEWIKSADRKKGPKRMVIWMNIKIFCCVLEPPQKKKFFRAKCQKRIIFFSLGTIVIDVAQNSINWKHCFILTDNFFYYFHIF